MVITIGLVVIFALGDFPSTGEDSSSYLILMQNKWALVHQPFSSRFLHAELVWLLTRFVHISIRSAVVLVAVASLSLFVLGMDRIFARLRVPSLLLVPVLVCIGFMETFRLVYMPDLFYSLLLVGLFLLLMDGRLLMSVLMVFVLFCARESTLVLGVVLVILSIQWCRKTSTRFDARAAGRVQWGWPVAFCVATTAGFLFNRYITSKSASNMHEMNGTMYLVGKVPFNFMKNVLGIAPWTDTLVATEGDQPLHQWPVPHGLHLGAIHRIGIAEVSARYPLRWLVNLLSMFGVLLTVVFRQAVLNIVAVGRGLTGGWRRLRAIVQGAIRVVLNEPFYSQVAVAYGIISLLIAPFLGTAVHRYIYYAWPAFWITGVRLLKQQYLESGTGLPSLTRWQLLVLHVILVWSPLLMSRSDTGWGQLLSLLCGVIFLQVVVWKLLAKVDCHFTV